MKCKFPSLLPLARSYAFSVLPVIRPDSSIVVYLVHDFSFRDQCEAQRIFFRCQKSFPTSSIVLQTIPSSMIVSSVLCHVWTLPSPFSHCIYFPFRLVKIIFGVLPLTCIPNVVVLLFPKTYQFVI